MRFTIRPARPRASPSAGAKNQLTQRREGTKNGWIVVCPGLRGFVAPCETQCFSLERLAVSPLQEMCAEQQDFHIAAKKHRTRMP